MKPAPLVFLHGFTGSPDALSPVVRGISTTRVVVPWLCGHGPDGSPNAATFDDEVDRLTALLGAEAKTWHLAGYSLGGRLAIGLLSRHPSLFASATLIGAQPGLATDAERAERRVSDERLCRLLAEDGIEAFVAAWEALPLFSTQAALPDDVRRRQREDRLKRDPHGLCRSLRATGLGVMPNYLPALERLTVPVTWVAGERDEKFSTIARSVAAKMPNATFRIVSGVGHNVPLEAGREVAELLESAVDRGK